MRRLIFVDAWFVIALVDPRDSHNRRARRLAAGISPEDLVTHDAVLAEMLTFFADDVALRSAGAALARRMLASVTVVPADREIFLRALDFYERRPDKEYSLVDCMSMVVMRDHGIEHVLTNDHHFQQEGFVVVSDAP